MDFASLLIVNVAIRNTRDKSVLWLTPRRTREMRTLQRGRTTRWMAHDAHFDAIPFDGGRASRILLLTWLKRDRKWEFHPTIVSVQMEMALDEEDVRDALGLARSQHACLAYCRAQYAAPRFVHVRVLGLTIRCRLRSVSVHGRQWNSLILTWVIRRSHEAFLGDGTKTPMVTVSGMRVREQVRA